MAGLDPGGHWEPREAQGAADTHSREETWGCGRLHVATHRLFLKGLGEKPRSR